jgi:hypothetical protein
MNKLKPDTSVIQMSRQNFRKQFIAAGGTKKDADTAYRDVGKQETYSNDLYFVQINRNVNHGFGDSLEDGMFELTIRKQDRSDGLDWRHVQLIKNQIVDPECEMVELYPAESRLRDSANQYWFYGFNNPKVRFPFGMFGRVVEDHGGIGKSKQRKFDT